MNVIHARTDFVRIFELFKGFQQIHIGTRGFDGDHVSIQRCNRIHDVVELAVTHVGVDLSIILRHGGIQFERVHRPIQVGSPVGLTQRQTFTQCRFVNLDDANAGFFQIFHFITQRQGDLFGNHFTGHIFTRE
ncbi:hypothetical protein D3C80_1621710 [compost metagenome]